MSKKKVQRFLLTVLIGAGSLLLGGVTALCWCFTANALLDRSPPEFRPVLVTDAIIETHDGVFREYQLKYRFLDEGAAGSSKTFQTTPEQIQRLGGSSIGIAEVHAGRFGWKWVKAIEPPSGSDGRQMRPFPVRAPTPAQ